MAIHPPPSYDGSGLVNLVSELERRLIGSSPSAPLHPRLSQVISPADTYVLVLFDGLGTHQLAHPAATSLKESAAASLDAPFTTTTTVSLATVATGVTATEHGVIGYTIWDPEIGTTVNTIHLRSVWGDPIDLDPTTLLPVSTVWERLRAQGIEPIVVQPANFQTTPLTRALYRGARFEGYTSTDDVVGITKDVASYPGRFVLVYVPFVDVAAHIAGQRSAEYSNALRAANLIWERLEMQLPDDVTLLGTADHGHADFAETNKIRISNKVTDRVRLSGDPRVLFVHGDPEPVLELGHSDWVDIDDLESYWGPGQPSDAFKRRLPDGAVFADDGYGLFPPSMNHRLVGYHGGLTDAERSIPLLAR